LRGRSSYRDVRAGSSLGIADSDGFVYLAFFAACSVACFTDEFAAAEAFVTLDGDEAAAVANVAIQHAFLGCQLARSLAFVAFRWYRACTFTLATGYFPISITNGTNQNKKHPVTIAVSRLGQPTYLVLFEPYVGLPHSICLLG
jgi:hypothetical protein